MNETLSKNDKLKSKKLIERLFSEGKQVKSYPFRMIYLPLDATYQSNIKVGFSVPKRLVKLAVHRNRIKRIMLEVYRKNKKLFTNKLNKPHMILLIYMHKEELNYNELELAIQKISKKFLTKIREDGNY